MEKRMIKLVKSDILAQGSSMFYYRGLGDPIFELVFRRIYGDEIDNVDSVSLTEEFEQRLGSLKGKLGNARGLAAEQLVRYYLLQAGRKQVALGDLSLETVDQPKQKLGHFRQIKKRSLHPEQDQRIEIDLFVEAESDGDLDMVVEVKDRERPVGAAQVDTFIAAKARIEPMLKRPAVFMMFSEQGFTTGQTLRLREHHILACDGKILAYQAEGD